MGKYTSPQEFKTIAGQSVIKNLLSRHFLILGIIILVLIGAAIDLYMRNTSTNSKEAGKACSAQATEPLLKDATAPITQANYEKATQAAGKIQALAGAEQDANCMYALVMHYINLSDSMKSRQYLDKLEKVYSNQHKFSPVFKQIVPLEDLKATVIFLEKQAEKIEKFGPPIPGKSS